MKKVYLYFREFELGNLTESDGKYLWTPNPDKIKEFNEKYKFSYLYKLNEIEPTIYDFMPHHFREYVRASKREDLNKNAKIESGDSEFEKLYKMASLNYFSEDFVIKLSNEER